MSVVERRIQLFSFFAALMLFVGSANVHAEEKAPLYPEHQNLLYYLDNAGQKHPVKTVADWEIRRQHILANMQIVMGPVPPASKKVPLDPKILEEVQLAGSLLRKK